MHLSDAPFAEKRFMTVHGRHMAHIDGGNGNAGVFPPPFEVLGCASER